MRTVEIPGGTAQLRENSEIKVRHRRLIEVAGVAAARPMEKVQREQRKLRMAGRDVEALNMAELNLDAGEAGRLMELQDAVLVATLASWTLEGPLPTIDTIGDLDQDVYDALAQATREQGAEIAAGVDFEPSDPAAPGFERTPTSPSASSEEPSAEGASESHETPSNGGASTASAASSAAPMTTT